MSAAARGSWLELFVEFAARAGNEDSAGGIAFAIFHTLYNPGRLAAFRAIGALGGVHDFLAVCRFGDLSHDSIFSWMSGFRGLKVGGGKCGGGARKFRLHCRPAFFAGEVDGSGGFARFGEMDRHQVPRWRKWRINGRLRLTLYC